MVYLLKFHIHVVVLFCRAYSLDCGGLNVACKSLQAAVHFLNLLLSVFKMDKMLFPVFDILHE